ncbi:MAG: hypothetical protein KGL43_03320 [Burkholderiales bacterium]|nr:hypothetical protein [Burkholderiales bacterium]MDE2395140.1 hypothetical protein [Burkholderiales bacterium]MDE2452602.1 hypothetical protein [Burkholderiales bacterium]
MKVHRILALAATACAATLAAAESPEAGHGARLEFRTIPMERAGGTEHLVMPYRLYDKLIVTVWDPIVCGQRPSEPSALVKGEKILIGYKLSAAGAAAKSCTLVSEFTVSDLPKRDLEVHFAGGAEPYTVAKMRKCPSYHPHTSDLWECLVPDTN